MSNTAYLLARIDLRSGRPIVENVGIYGEPSPTARLGSGMWAIIHHATRDTFDQAKTTILNDMGQWCPALLPFISPR